MFTNLYKADSLNDGLVTGRTPSGQASTVIPSIFFNVDRLNQYDLLRLDRNNLVDYARQKDERINGVACYVLSVTPRTQSSRYSKFIRSTLWIGKRDLLIRQCQEISEFQQTVPLKTDAEIAANLQRMNNNRLSPSLLAQLVKEQQQSEAELRRPRRIITIQIHDEIAVNQPLTKEDFVPPIPPGLGLPEALHL